MSRRQLGPKAAGFPERTADPTPTPEQPRTVAKHRDDHEPVRPFRNGPLGYECARCGRAVSIFARPEQDEAVRLLRAVVQHWDGGSIDSRYDEMAVAFDDARDFLHRNGGVATPPPVPHNDSASETTRGNVIGEARPSGQTQTVSDALPTPPPVPAALTAKIEQTSRIYNALYGCESMGALENWLIEELAELRGSASILATPPDDTCPLCGQYQVGEHPDGVCPPVPAAPDQTPEDFWRSVGEWAVEQGVWQREAVPATPPLDVLSGWEAEEEGGEFYRKTDADAHISPEQEDADDQKRVHP